MKPKFVAIEESEWLVYAVLPHKGDGMTLKEISQFVENIPVRGYWSVEFLTAEKVKNALHNLCKKGLAEVVETPEGKRYRRKPLNFKFPIKVCQHCGSPFLARNMKRKFCSDSCRVKHHLRFCDKCRAKAMQHLDEFVKHKTKRLGCEFEDDKDDLYTPKPKKTLKLVGNP